MEVAERTDSGRLFKVEGAQGRNLLVPAWVLTLGTHGVFALSDLNEWEGASGVKMNRPYFTNSFVGQQTDLSSSLNCTGNRLS